MVKSIEAKARKRKRQDREEPPEQEDIDLDPRDALEILALRACRDSFKSFIQLMWPRYRFSDTGFHDKLIKQLEAMERGEILRQTISVPPRHGKSLTTTQLFPAWWLGRHPDAQIIVASYGAELAEGFSRQIRDIIKDERYRAVFPDTELSLTTQSIANWMTTRGGRLLAQGVQGSLTGYGADLFIIDDPVKDREQAESPTVSEKTWDWYKSVAMTRLSPKARVIVCCTRWNVNDLVGRILAQEDAEDWNVINFPALDANGNALWPDQYDAVTLNKIRATSGEFEFSALYQGEPYQRGGRYVNPENLIFAPRATFPPKLTMHRVIDLATSAKKTADFTVSLKVACQYVDGAPVYYVIDGWHMKAEWPRVKTQIIMDAGLDGPMVPIHVEAVAGFLSAYQDLKHELMGRARVRRVDVHTDKICRSLGWVNAIEAKRLYIAEDQGRVPWQSEMKRQLEAFPAGSVKDDYPDALSIMAQLNEKARSRIVLL